MTSEQTIIFQNIQYPTHLTENQHSRPFHFHSLKQFVKDDHLSGVFYNVFIGCVWWTRLSTIEEIRMAGDFAKLTVQLLVQRSWKEENSAHLHDHVHKSCLSFFLASQTIHCIDIFFKYRPVPLPLHITKTNIDVNFFFWNRLSVVRDKY